MKKKVLTNNDSNSKENFMGSNKSYRSFVTRAMCILINKSHKTITILSVFRRIYTLVELKVKYLMKYKEVLQCSCACYCPSRWNVGLLELGLSVSQSIYWCPVCRFIIHPWKNFCSLMSTVRNISEESKSMGRIFWDPHFLRSDMLFDNLYCILSEAHRNVKVASWQPSVGKQRRQRYDCNQFITSALDVCG